MFDFYEVNFEVKIRRNVGKICETVKSEDISCAVTMEADYSKDVSSRVSSTFIILTHVKRNVAEVKCNIKITKKI